MKDYTPEQLQDFAERMQWLSWLLSHDLIRDFEEKRKSQSEYKHMKNILGVG